MAAPRLKHDSASVLYDDGTDILEECKVEKTQELDELFDSPLFQLAGKKFDAYEDLPLKKKVFDLCTSWMEEKIKPRITAIEFVELLDINEIGEWAEKFNSLIPHEQNPIFQRNYLDISGYLYFRAVELADETSYGMLGWYFWETRQLALAWQLFTLSLKTDPSRDNISHVGLSLLMMKNHPGEFEKEYKFLKEDFFLKSSKVAREWYPQISHWITLVGDAYRNDPRKEGKPRRLVKASMCYELASLYDKKNSVAKNHLETALFLNAPTSSPLVSSSSSSSQDPAAFTIPVTKLQFASALVRVKFFSLKLGTDKRLDRLDEEERNGFKRRRGLGSGEG